MERCQAGDSAAFGNLYARYYERLLRFCLRRLNDRHEAEDAAQEAFARAWKALPRFAGERRFYPWLTVIAGNICTDMLRRRSRSTPTDDMELTAQRPVGVVAEDTSEELVLAAVDGELVNRALDRLSTRHRHVLAMREGSGWTYQQIADHEGVEIGTIETLLWRARQALKREFAVVSESKEALAGFLIATGALIRRTVFRAAHRGATVHHSSGGGSGAMRNAVAGVAVTSAAVAAAFIAPHALSSGPSGAASAQGSALAAPPLAVGATRFGTESGGSAAAAQALALGGSTGASGGGSGAPGGGSVRRVWCRIRRRWWLQFRRQGFCGWCERSRLAARRCAQWRVVVRHQRTLGRAEQHHRRTEHDGERCGRRSESDRRWRHGRRPQTSRVRRRSAASRRLSPRPSRVSRAASHKRSAAPREAWVG